MNPMLHAEILADRSYRPTEGDFVVRTMVRMQVSDLAERLPLRLCLAIDKSLSMRGEKIERAKESARQLIEAMDAEDEFALLAFGSQVETLVEPKAMDDIRKQEALAALDALQAGGVTRLDLALDEAYGLLSATGGERLGMLLLLSDGAPTNPLGYVLPETQRDKLQQCMGAAFRENGHLTSAIGLGDAEACLAPYLEACAEAGGGMFYHEDSGAGLAQRFLEEFNRVKESAIVETRLALDQLAGTLRRAACVYPDIRQLATSADDESLLVEIGALKRGEAYVLLLEVVTEPAPAGARCKLCDMGLQYRIGGETKKLQEQGPLLEYTDDEILLGKPPHDEVEKYKAMFAAFKQTAHAAENIRRDVDQKRTKLLLQNAAKTTQRLGLSRQTKRLDDVAKKVDAGETVSPNELTAVTSASRKTKVLHN